MKASRSSQGSNNVVEVGALSKKRERANIRTSTPSTTLLFDLTDEEFFILTSSDVIATTILAASAEFKIDHSVFGSRIGDGAWMINPRDAFLAFTLNLPFLSIGVLERNQLKVAACQVHNKLMITSIVIKNNYLLVTFMIHNLRKKTRPTARMLPSSEKGH